MSVMVIKFFPPLLNTAGGYVTSFESMSEPTDVKEILNVLNVGELRDLLHMVNKTLAMCSNK